MFDANERAWIAGRATGLRLEGLDAVAASQQATYEAQQVQKGLVPVHTAEGVVFKTEAELSQ